MAQPSQVLAENEGKVPFWRRTVTLLLLIVILGAFLRLVKPGQSPPGLNQDEAANGWNAYCLLKTGKDQVGVSWPIFYTRALGGNRTTLYIYLLLPFQAVGGLNIYTTRLPAAVGGVLTILLIYFVGRRLFDRQIGLAAAFFLALNPWHIQQSRWGHEASVGALLGLVPLVMMLWANLPLDDDNGRVPHPFVAALAGAVIGICCYGYHGVRLFVPVFLLAACLVTLPAWWRWLKTRRGALAVALFILTFAVTFSPLAWQHIFHAAGIGRHGQNLSRAGLLIGSEPLPIAVSSFVSRYIQHFGPDFLFVRGDDFSIQSPPGAGQYHWYMLPLMILGLIAIFRRLKPSRAARILLVFIVTYPIGDCLYHTDGAHALRSSPGLCSLILLAGVGAVSTGRWLWKQGRLAALAVTAGFVITVIGLNGWYLHRFYGEYNRQPEIYHGYHADLVEACDWLRGRFDDADAVFCTTDGMNQPYIITLVALGYDPQRWFRQQRDFVPTESFDIYTSYGKMRFMYGQSFIPALKELQQSNQHNRIIFIVRPGELGLKDPIHQIYRPDGKVTLWICQPGFKGTLTPDRPGG